MANTDATTATFKYKIVGDKEIDDNGLEWIITYDDKILKRVMDSDNQTGYSEVKIYDRIKD